MHRLEASDRGRVNPVNQAESVPEGPKKSKPLLKKQAGEKVPACFKKSALAFL
jgi:hypothetical protein